MDVREKLVELLDDVQRCGEEYTDYEIYGMRVPDTVSNEDVALHLIAHGVTVQEWISVNDRLPEIASTHKRYRGTIKKSIRVLCVCVQKSGKTMVKEGYCEWYNDYPEHRWQIPGTIDEVTHWQYLPKLPKGD